VDDFARADLPIEESVAGARAHAARQMRDALRGADRLAAGDRLAAEHAIALLYDDSAGTRHQGTDRGVR
jgi:hypothetical protein